jgi:hypothetical protein
MGAVLFPFQGLGQGNRVLVPLDAVLSTPIINITGLQVQRSFQLSLAPYSHLYVDHWEGGLQASGGASVTVICHSGWWNDSLGHIL